MLFSFFFSILELQSFILLSVRRLSKAHHERVHMTLKLFLVGRGAEMENGSFCKEYVIPVMLNIIPAYTHTHTEQQQFSRSHTGWNVLANDITSLKTCDLCVFHLCPLLLPSTLIHPTYCSIPLSFSSSLPPSLALSFSLPGFNFQGRLPNSACRALLSRLPPKSVLLSPELPVMNEREKEKEGWGTGKVRRWDKSATNQKGREMLFKHNEWESHLHASLWLQASFHLFTIFFYIIQFPNK